MYSWLCTCNYSPFPQICLEILLFTVCVDYRDDVVFLTTYYRHHPGKTRIYFYTGFVSYMIGLGTTVGVMHFFKAAQPALLYLVPSCLGLPFLVALIKGDLPALFRYAWYVCHVNMGSCSDITQFGMCTKCNSGYFRGVKNLWFSWLGNKPWRSYPMKV